MTHEDATAGTQVFLDQVSLAVKQNLSSAWGVPSSASLVRYRCLFIRCLDTAFVGADRLRARGSNARWSKLSGRLRIIGSPALSRDRVFSILHCHTPLLVSMTIMRDCSMPRNHVSIQITCNIGCLLTPTASVVIDPRETFGRLCALLPSRVPRAATSHPVAPLDRHR